MTHIYKLPLLALLAIGFAVAARLEGRRPAVWALASAGLSSVTAFWLNWGVLDWLIVQALLFAGMWADNLRRKPHP